MAKNVELTCDFCGDKLTQLKEVELVDGLNIANVGIVRLQGRVRECCEVCLGALKRVTEDPEAWAPFKRKEAKRLKEERERIAAEDKARADKAEQDRIAAEAAKLSIVEADRPDDEVSQK